MDCHVEDDLLLSKIKLEDDCDPVMSKSLSPLEQVILLSECINMESSEARDELLDERLVPFLEAVLAAPRVWCVQYTALFVRSRLEMRKTRRMERSMMQLEALVDGTSKSSTLDVANYDGCKLFFALPMPLSARVSQVRQQFLWFLILGSMWTSFVSTAFQFQNTYMVSWIPARLVPLHRS